MYSWNRLAGDQVRAVIDIIARMSPGVRAGFNVACAPGGRDGVEHVAAAGGCRHPASTPLGEAVALATQPRSTVSQSQAVISSSAACQVCRSSFSTRRYRSYAAKCVCRVGRAAQPEVFGVMRGGLTDVLQGLCMRDQLWLRVRNAEKGLR